jgi:hypothetical protein
VKSSLPRRLACSLAVVCGLLQPLLGSGTLFGALALVASHGHALSVLADAGHVDLVLTHATLESEEEHHASEPHVHASVRTDDSHVVHLASTDAACDSMRRASHAPAPTACILPPLSSQPRRAATLARRAETPARASPLLETVVLRI